MDGSIHLSPDAADGLDYPLVRIDNRNYDLGLMDRSGLHELSLQLIADMARLDQQLAANAWKQEAEDAEARHWFYRTAYLRRMRVRQLEAVRGEIAVVKQRQAQSVAQAFVNVARECLPADQFRSLLESAKALALG